METLHSRHHSTVLPRFGESKKESLQNMHTHHGRFGHSAPRKEQITEKRPSPIADEKRVSRKHRCTLTQLRSGHCHLLPEYKDMVVVEPSYICTDCGASQHVRHLLACNAHPTELTPEDLWQGIMEEACSSQSL